MMTTVYTPCLRVAAFAGNLPLILLPLAIACGGGKDRTVTEPPPPPPPSSGYVLSVSAHTDDAAVAQALGWGSGIPEVELTLAPVGGTGGEVRATTDEAGKARIDGLSQGSYLVTARRLLSDAERSGLGTASDAMAFVGADTLRVSSGTGTGALQLPVSYRGSLLINEVYQGQRLVIGLGTYAHGGFIELYNNADTTVYMDGTLVANALAGEFDCPTCVVSCAEWARMTDDPAGVWTRWIAAFPGSGREHPLRPGELVVVATDAVDHSVLYPGMLDLRGADFEFPGSADADNPAVPNMVDFSTAESVFRHGLYFGSSLAAVLTVSHPADPGGFMRGKRPHSDSEVMRVPREQIMDALTTVSLYFRTRPDLHVCSQLVHRSMDRQFGWLISDVGNYWERSIGRRVLTTLDDGRPLLQNTRSSASDFVVTPITLREVVP